MDKMSLYNKSVISPQMIPWVECNANPNDPDKLLNVPWQWDFKWKNERPGIAKTV